MMKKIKIGLLPRIILAIALGIAFGNILPGGLVRIFVTFNGIFSELLGFIIPLIILGLVTPAIADIGKEAGKNAGSHHTHSVWSNLVFGISFLLYRHHIFSVDDYSRRFYRTDKRSP